MTDLVPYQPLYGVMLAPEKVAALSALAPADKKIIEASLTGALKAANYTDAFPKIIDIITATFLQAGQGADETLEAYAHEFYNTLVEKYPLITLDEVRIALRNGVYEEYGEYFGLNPKSFLQFIRGYLFSRDRQAAKDRYNTAKQLAAPKAPEIKYHDDANWTAEMTGIWKDITQSFYRWYLEDNPLYDAAPEGCYWLLKREGKIAVPAHYQDNLIKRGKSVLRAQAIKNNSRLHSDQVARILKQIDEQTDRETVLKTRLVGKRIAVFNFFQKQKRKGVIQLF